MACKAEKRNPVNVSRVFLLNGGVACNPLTFAEVTSTRIDNQRPEVE